MIVSPIRTLPKAVKVTASASAVIDRPIEVVFAFEAWIKDQGRQCVGPAWEVYWTDPGEVPDPADWNFELLWPIE